jgi:nucleotide-binding universal stress UspA family protein
MKTVLAPIDFSSVSERVIETATALARATGARLVLLHVVAPWPIIGKNLALTLTGAELAAVAEKGAAKKLSLLQRSLRDDGVTAHAVHVSGDPRVCILEQAERLTADYIVIGSHGHTAFYDLLVGSTANGVLKRTSCSIVIVPHGAKEASYEETAVAAVGA